MSEPPGDWRERAVVRDSKLSDYLLSPVHGVGRYKARFLMSRGFDPANLDAVREAILAHLAASPDATGGGTEFGTKYVVTGTLKTPDGRDPLVRSVWFESTPGGEVLLVTLYPVRGKR